MAAKTGMHKTKTARLAPHHAAVMLQYVKGHRLPASLMAGIFIVALTFGAVSLSGTSKPTANNFEAGGKTGSSEALTIDASQEDQQSTMPLNTDGAGANTKAQIEATTSVEQGAKVSINGEPVDVPASGQVHSVGIQNDNNQSASLNISVENNSNGSTSDSKTKVKTRTSIDIDMSSSNFE